MPPRRARQPLAEAAAPHANAASSTGAEMDNDSKAPLNKLLRRLHLPQPRYETIVHTSYSIRIILPAELRTQLAATADAEMLQKWERSIAKSKATTDATAERDGRQAAEDDAVVWTAGRPAKEKRDAVRRTVEGVMAQLGPWAQQQEAKAMRRREWRMQKRERKWEQRQQKREQKRDHLHHKSTHGTRREDEPRRVLRN